ncbi:MAG: hypothetical protein GY851_31125 [bacterium]|nr:hypothetical protein [bacterium]
MMTPSGQPDCFHVVNGPEDGTRLPVMRAPIHIGSNSRCAARISLDNAVRPFHAQVTAVSDGYRIRKKDTGPVYVDGKRAGLFRSRIVRSGGVVKVGDTLLCLECAPDGLARRSRGIVSETDVGWAVQQVVRGVAGAIRGVAGFVMRVFGRILTSWLAILAIVFLAFYFSDWLRGWAYYGFSWVRYMLFSR